jgi:hypothetical protein
MRLENDVWQHLEPNQNRRPSLWRRTWRKTVREEPSNGSPPLVLSVPKPTEPAPHTHQAIRPASPLEPELVKPDPVPIEDQYVYESLDTTQRQIRLIKVYHGASNPYPQVESVDFGCAIHIYDTDEMPPYIALSYTWGAPLPVHRVWVNGKLWIVRENLYNFLKSFVQNKMQETEHLWIDSLCIDQRNTRERNHQVSMMADIYRDSQFVITWLDESCYQPLQSIIDGSRSSQHLESIMTNRYFSRLWIVQEVTLAKHVKIMCNDILIDWNVLRDIAVFPDIHKDRRAASLLFHYVMNKKDVAGLNNVGSGTLPSKILSYSAMDCEDQRDKVYGLLGLVEPQSSVPEIDYSKSVERVFLDALRIILMENHVESVPRLLDIAQFLIRNMCLPKRHQVALENLFKSIGKHYFVIVRRGSHPRDLPVDAIDLEGTLSSERWWYDYQGQRYFFPVTATGEHFVDIHSHG